MFDLNETACVLAGVAAVGVVYLSQTSDMMSPRYRASTATECSARLASTESPFGVSARAASVEKEPLASTMEEKNILFQGEMWNNMSTEGMQAMSQNAGRFPGGGRNSETTKKNLESVKPVLSLETTGAKTVGMKTLICGRCGNEAIDAKKPDVTGGCMFFMSDAYADRLMTKEG